MHRVAITGIAVIAALIASPAEACRVASSAQYLLWFALPSLQPGEVAIEIDLKDFVANPADRGFPIATYKVKRVRAGPDIGQHVRVQNDGSTCSHLVGEGASDHFILVGQLRETPNGAVLIPRYMPHGDPIHVAAQR